MERLRAEVRRRPAPDLLEVAVVRSVAAAEAARDHRAHAELQAAAAVVVLLVAAVAVVGAEEEDGDKLETQTLNFESHEDQNAVNGAK